MSDPNTINAKPLECPFTFEILSCEEIARRHKDCTDPECLICQFHEALRCHEE